MELPTKEEYEKMSLDKREGIFENFLMEGTVAKKYEQYADVINGSNKFVKENLFNYIEIEEVEKKFNEIRSKSDYEEINKYTHRIIPAALKKYIEFLRQISRKNITISKDGLNPNYDYEYLKNLKPSNYYYVSKNGEKIYRNKEKGEQEISAAGLSKLAIQIFKERLDNLDKTVRNVLKINRNHEDGIWKEDEFKAKWGNPSDPRFSPVNKYKENDIGIYYFFGFGFFDSLNMCESLMKKFNDDGKFIIEFKNNDITNDKNDIKDKIPLNQILYGPPGTGKTYNTINKALEIIYEKDFIEGKNREELKEEFEKLSKTGQIVFITFHQSMSYEDFIEGIKPNCDNNESISYKIEDGIFKRICNQATGTANYENEFDIVWQKLIECISDNGKIAIPKSKGRDLEYGLSSKESLKFLYPEGAGTLTKDNIFDVYRGLKARESGAYQNYMEAVVKYLKEKYGLSEYNENNIEDHKKYILIIDEINRGNVSQIFGELITLIEEDKRIGKDEELKIILPYSKKEFGVPNNLYIIGTMNTADRSVEALDTALRRRFSFIEMMPYYELEGLKRYKDIDLPLLLEKINKRIEKLLDREHQIGHSYFLKVEDLEGLRRVFKDNILPLLQEYFFGDYGKIGKVLGKKFVEKIPEKETEFADFDYEIEGKDVYKLKDPFEKTEEGDYELTIGDFKSIYE